MKHRTIGLLLALTACGRGELGSATQPEDASEVSAPKRSKHTLTLRVRGAGSVGGVVHSSPTGIDCVSDVVRPDRECSASFAHGQPVKLTYSPGGAGMLAQFFILRGASWDNCGATPAAAGLTCDLVLTADTQVQVFPISVPPPP
jgi:hypothetical protein